MASASDFKVQIEVLMFPFLYGIYLIARNNGLV